MKKFLLQVLFVPALFIGVQAFSQNNSDTAAALGLPGDNLDLYAVLSLFQKSKTIEAFEQSLNSKETGINNLDLDLNDTVDFIKVVTLQDGKAFSFTLQVDVTQKETQDVAVILLNKDKNDKVSLQIVGDEALYGKDYVIEPAGNSSVTPNPAYKGADSVKVSVVPSTSVVVVESAPVVQYVYSPVYVPYYPPYHYAYYPPYFAFFTCVAIGVYRSNHYYYHHGYYGGHYGGGNTVIINTGNRNTINHYNNNRHVSNTVVNNRANGVYGNGVSNGIKRGVSAGTQPASKGGAAGGARASGGGASASTQPAKKGGSGGAGVSNASASNRSTSASTLGSGGGSGYAGANRSTSNYPSANTSSRSSYSRSSGSSGRSMSSGGRSRGGGGRRR